MSDNQTRTVQHDGVRNFFGGRNMILLSASPAFQIEDAAFPPIAGMAVAGITMLVSDMVTADLAMADFAVLTE